MLSNWKTMEVKIIILAALLAVSKAISKMVEQQVTREALALMEYKTGKIRFVR